MKARLAIQNTPTAVPMTFSPQSLRADAVKIHIQSAKSPATQLAGRFGRRRHRYDSPVARCRAGRVARLALDKTGAIVNLERASNV